MNVALKRRLARASLDVESGWRSAWEAWALAVVLEWREMDPQASYETLRPYEEEWASLSTAEERAGFLSRGASLCVLHGLPPDLWAWFWRDVYGPVLDGDLNAWPRLIPQAPEVSGEVLSNVARACNDSARGVLMIAWVAAVVAR